MRIPRMSVAAAVVAAGLMAAAAALAVGPWPGIAPAVVDPAAKVRYTALRTGASTAVKAERVADGKVLASASFTGTYGIPAVTSTGRAGGLSPDGRLLVLAEPPSDSGLRSRSSFLLLSTPRLTLRKRIVLPGEFGFDAVSPDGRTLYLIQHASSRDLSSYVVRAYDLRRQKLLQGAIVDKRNVDEVMRGQPVARAESERGVWVYTLYRRETGNAFVHALNTARRTAFCIDFDWRATDQALWSARLELRDRGRRLLVRTRGSTVATIDTQTLRVS